jgi:Phage capsid-like protein/Cyclic nucleotide-binding domain
MNDVATDGKMSAEQQLSLSTNAARNLATVTKSAPQMQGITSRWLLKVLPWVQVSAGTYRVNRRVVRVIAPGRVSFSNTGADVRVVPETLAGLPALRTLADPGVLNALAGQFKQREYAPGDVIVEQGKPANRFVLIAHGKASKTVTGKFDDDARVDVLSDGDHVGAESLVESPETFQATLTALTRCIVLSLPITEYNRLLRRSQVLQVHLDALREQPAPEVNKAGEAAIRIASGHEQEDDLPGTFVDYELSPREYKLSAAQTVLRIHTRVADLYNEPMDQTKEQLRLTIEGLRERQELEMVNNREFGLLDNADLRQRIRTSTGPPTPDDLDELLSRRRGTRFLFAHPRAIAAFGRECTKRGVYPDNVSLLDSMVPAWRGVPMLPCTKIPVSDTGTTSIIAMRTGEHDEGVIGLHQTGIPDEYEPSLSVRFMGINEKSVISYLVTAYYSVAVLVPDALGILEDVEVTR